MSRLIDADMLKSAIARYSEKLLSHKNLSIVKNAIREVLGDINFAIDIQPTIDAVPVVRCIECKYASFSFHQGELYISCENNNWLFRDVPEDGYCYCGEKVTE